MGLGPDLMALLPFVHLCMHAAHFGGFRPPCMHACKSSVNLSESWVAESHMSPGLIAIVVRTLAALDRQPALLLPSCMHCRHALSSIASSKSPIISTYHGIPSADRHPLRTYYSIATITGLGFSQCSVAKTIIALEPKN